MCPHRQNGHKANFIQFDTTCSKPIYYTYLRNLGTKRQALARKRLLGSPRFEAVAPLAGEGGGFIYVNSTGAQFLFLPFPFLILRFPVWIVSHHHVEPGGAG